MKKVSVQLVSSGPNFRKYRFSEPINSAGLIRFVRRKADSAWMTFDFEEASLPLRQSRVMRYVGREICNFAMILGCRTQSTEASMIETLIIGEAEFRVEFCLGLSETKVDALVRRALSAFGFLISFKAVHPEDEAIPA